jgi:hypothetical protein
MITYPALPQKDANDIIRRWMEAGSDLGGEWVLGPDLFNRCSWPVIQRNRVSLGTMHTLRNNLAAVLPTDLAASPEGTDFTAAKCLWSFFAGDGQLSLSQASDGGFWRWMSVRILPDLIYKRSGNQFSLPRFLSIGSNKRCWPQRLYWMAWICSDGAGNLSEGLLSVLSKTDIQSGLLERTGSGYDREMYQSILSVLQRREPGQWAMLTRGVMKRLTAIRGTRETCILNPDQKLELSEELIQWALKYYRAG